MSRRDTKPVPPGTVPGVGPLVQDVDVWAFVESLPHHFWTCLATGECDYLSPQWVAYTGIAESPQLGYGWLEQLHPDDRATVDQSWAQAVARDAVFDIEFRIRRHDGVYRWFKTRACPVKDAEGMVAKWFGSNTDIQELRDAKNSLEVAKTRLEERVQERTLALEEANAQLELAQSIAKVGSWSFEPPTGAMDLSAEFYRIVGLDPSSGQQSIDQFETLFSPSSWVRANELVAHCFATGESFEVELELTPPSGEKHIAVSRGRALRDASGAIKRVVGTLRDITALSRALRARAASTRALEVQTIELGRSNRDLDQFAFAASHDMQEPLRAVEGCAQLLQRKYEGQLDSEADELIEHIVQGAERMRTLITGLLAYARVEGHGGEPGLIEASRAFEQAVENLGITARESGATFECGPLPRVRADRTQLTQLFQNLLDNAIKYSGASPRVRVSAEHAGDLWTFSVADDGIGIEPRFTERIFKLFQRLHTRTEFPGTGIGLALCQRIVERHGGRIWVESTLGEGATFRFTLPSTERPSGPPTNEADR